MEDNTLYKFLGAIIFDLDGTLIDSMTQHRTTFGNILSENFRMPKNISEEIYMQTAGKPLDEQFEIALREFEIQSTNITSLVDEFWRRIKEIKFDPFSDVPLALKTLHKVGYALFITSGSTNDVVQAKLEHAGIRNYIKIALGSDYSATTVKKGVGHFKLIQEYLGLESDVFRRNTVFVGDGKHDMYLASQERFIGVLRVNEGQTTNAEADIYIHNLDELVTKLKSANSPSCDFIEISELRKQMNKQG